MHFTSALFVPLALLAGFVSAGDFEKRAGPSGSVIKPAGGTNIDSIQGYPTGKIDFVYKPVYKSKSSDCAFFGCTIETFYVSVGLRDSKGKTTMLAEYLGSDAVQENIEATLVVPKNFCGSYNLVVREYQNAYGSFYNFQSAAPKINIECDPTP